MQCSAKTALTMTMGVRMATGPVHFELRKSQLFPYNGKVELSVFTLTREAHLMGWTAA